MSSSWVPGVSGNGVYDPVTTSDNVNFQPSDQDGSWCQFKRQGRIYNFGTYRKSGLKAVCDEIRNRSRPRCLLVACLATIVLVLLVLIIVIAASHSSTHYAGQSEWRQWVNRSVVFDCCNFKPRFSIARYMYMVMAASLNFEPAGYMNTVLIDFSQDDGLESSYSSYVQNLDTALERYQNAYLHNGSHVLCNKTYNPPDSICQQRLKFFGESCTTTYKYGYSAGQPCLLLYFNLPKGYSARGLLPKDGDTYTQAEQILGQHFSPDYIGISCEPSVQDKDFVGKSNQDEDAIEYNPKSGFPVYFFRPRSIDYFVPPAVMVQFHTIHQSLIKPHTVRITCTAWGKAFDENGVPVNNDVFSTSFALRIH